MKRWERLKGDEFDLKPQLESKVQSIEGRLGVNLDSHIKLTA